MQKRIRTFYILTITQVFSIVGSAMTNVAIGIRVFNDTGNSTPLMLASFFAALPLMIGGSFAGVFADRWNRRMILIFSDLGQAVGTVLLLLSFSSGNFQLWHLYLISALSGTLAMFQRPAMDASVTLLVPDQLRDRANAIRLITGPTAGVIAPVITGLVYTLIGVTGVMLVDLATFVVAILVVLSLHIPQPEKTAHESASSVLQDFKAGLRFLLERRIILYLMIYSAVINFLLSGPINLATPYIITLTGSERTLGILLGAMNAGIVIGGVIVMIWGGTRPRIHGIMLGLIFRGIWLAVFGIVRTPLMLGVALFFVFFSSPLIDASFMSIMQAKVPPNMQGRVFSILFQLMYIANPLSLLITGPLADDVLEPAVGEPGWAGIAPLVGSEAGSGMGVLILIAGSLIALATVLVYLWPKTRSVEADLPDVGLIDA
ncbi:MAG: MFS transporter [Anaerolineales bacterium]